MSVRESAYSEWKGSPPRSTSASSNHVSKKDVSTVVNILQPREETGIPKRKKKKILQVDSLAGMGGVSRAHSEEEGEVAVVLLPHLRLKRGSGVSSAEKEK